MNVSLLNDLKKIICECDPAVDIKDIKEDSDLIKDFCFNSLNFIRLMVAIEDEFDIEIGLEHLASGELSNVNKLYNLVSSTIKDKGSLC